MIATIRRQQTVVGVRPRGVGHDERRRTRTPREARPLRRLRFERIPGMDSVGESRDTRSPSTHCATGPMRTAVRRETLRPGARRARGHTVNVRTPLENCVGYCCSGIVAGPIPTAPVVVNCDPWHGHTNRLLENPVIVQPSCVHVAVRAVNESCAVWATRNVPNGVCTIAAEPTVASGEVASIVTDTTCPATVAEAAPSWGTEGDEGDVGLPPPHAASVPTANGNSLTNLSTELTP